MEKFVIRGQSKHSCTNDARSPQKKIKLENDERMKQEEEEEEEHAASAEFSDPVPWQKIEAEGFDCDYALLFSKEEADRLFKQLEEEVVYATGTTSNLFLYSYHQTLQYSPVTVAVFVPGEEARVQLFGKVHNIPRKQATYGEAGLTYTYSGVTRLACQWTPTLEYIRDSVTKATGQTFNFVLVNR